LRRNITDEINLLNIVLAEFGPTSHIANHRMGNAQETTSSCATGGLDEGREDALDITMSECFICISA
jgi:hypothetical protein